MNSKNEQSMKQSQNQNLNVLAEIVLVIQVQTGGEADEDQVIPDEDVPVFLCENPDMVKRVVEAVNASQEHQDALAAINVAISLYREKYPNTKILFTPMRALKELEEI
jgi:hypothetical protein